MAQVLHQRATTTHAIREDLQRSTESVAALSRRYGINPKTVRKWRSRTSVEDVRMGPKAARSTSLTPLEEAAAITFRQKTLLPLDDCLHALQRDPDRRRQGLSLRGSGSNVQVRSCTAIPEDDKAGGR